MQHVFARLYAELSTLCPLCVLSVLVFSLVRFLCVKPYTYYYCKNCPCTYVAACRCGLLLHLNLYCCRRSVEYRLDPGGRFCSLCGHSPMRHFNWLNRFVLNPIKQFGYTGPGRDAMELLRREVLDGLLLRRTKAGRAADLSLPSRTIVLRDDLELDLFEKDYYEALYTQSRARFDAYVANSTVSNNYAHLFDLLTRLRQSVCHPYLIQYGQSSAASAAIVSDEDDAADVCGICREASEDPVTTGCRHVFCRLCVREYLEGLGTSSALSAVLRDATVDGVDDNLDAVAVRDLTAKNKKARPTGTTAPAAPTCPTCLAPLTVDLQIGAAAASAVSSGVEPAVKRKSKSILSRLPSARVGGSFRSSSKIEALLEELWRAQAEEPGCSEYIARNVCCGACIPSFQSMQKRWCFHNL